MPSFSFLKLPYLARIRVLEVMNGEDLLVFSFISKSSKNLAIAARRSIEKFELNLDRVLYLEYSLGHLLKIPMKKSLEEARKSEQFEFWKVNGQLVPMYRTSIENLSYWYMGDCEQSEENNYQLIVQYSNHILEVFRSQEFQVAISDREPIQNLFILKHTRRFKRFSYCDSDRRQRPTDFLKFILEELEVKYLTLVHRATPDFQWNGPLRMYSLEVGYSEWLTLEALMNSECSYMELHDHKFNEEQMNMFIKKWLDGGLPNLEYCSLWTEYVEDLSEDVILQGIRTMPWNTDNHPARHHSSGLSNGVDICRSDGVFATVAINVAYDECHKVTLAVWKN